MSEGAFGPAQALGRRAPAAGIRAAHVWTALAAASLTLAGSILAFSFFAVFRLHVALPIWDTWLTLADAKLVKAGTYGWAELTRQHNEHRLLFPRLLFWADRAWFAMSDRDLLVETFALQGVTAAVIVRLGWRRCPDRRLRAIVLAFVVAVLFSLSQEQNLTAGFQVQFVGVFTAAALGAVAYAEGLDRLGAAALGGGPRPGGWPRLALGGLAAFVATYTMANGVLLGPVLFALALLLRAPRRAVIATLAVAAALAAAFFDGFEPGPESGSIATVVAHPLRTAGFVLAYLGSPAGPDLRVALPFGVLGLAGLGLAAVRLATGRSQSPAAAALVAVMAFVVASACATAYGRVQFGIEEAFETRYVTPAAVFWSALVALASGEVSLRGAPAGFGAGLRLAVLAVAAAWLMASAAVLEATAWPAMVDRATAMQRFRDSLWSGLYDLDASSYENNADSDLRPLVPFLAAERLSLFAGPEPQMRGLPVGAAGALAPPDACTGTVLAKADPALGQDGVRLTGTAWDRSADRPVRRILTVGPAGTVSGFGSPDRPVGGSDGWTAYATAAPGTIVAAYAVLRDGRLCRLGAGEAGERNH